MNISKLSLLLITTYFLAGCSQVGPDYKAPKKVALPSSWTETTDENISQEWWKLFGDETLNTLVNYAQKQNLDLRAAGLRILQARTILGISEGLNYPQVQSLSGALGGFRKNGNTFLNAGVSFDVGWEMDIWGKYARGIESSQATLYAAFSSREDIAVSLIAEVARNYINYTTAKERISYAKRNIELQERVVEMTQIQHNAGNVSELDVQQAKTQLYSTMSILPSLQLSMIKSENAIAVLLGTLPSDIANIIDKKEENLKLIPMLEIPNDFAIPANVISRRPDLKVAEYQMRAQSAKIGMSEAELYPHFSLFGSIGYSTQNALGEWLSPANAIGISAGPSFSWNIFQYDRIKNKVRYEDAKFQESILHYNKKVLQAVQEASNALNGYKLTKEQLELSKKTIDANQRAFDISMTQYENGLVSYERLLNTLERLTRNEDKHASIQGTIAINAIALYKALGGGWDVSKEKSYLNAADVREMKNRSDWGKYFDDENNEDEK
jgi:NodT family efflux transporter outer membrane factor (OMF) lipoprotein